MKLNIWRLKMTRKPRVVKAGQPLHVIQRGNDRQAVFYADEDYQRYLDDLDIITLGPNNNESKKNPTFKSSFKRIDL